jgi:hypothetical protein
MDEVTSKPGPGLASARDLTAMAVAAEQVRRLWLDTAATVTAPALAQQAQDRARTAAEAAGRYRKRADAVRSTEIFHRPAGELAGLVDAHVTTLPGRRAHVHVSVPGWANDLIGQARTGGSWVTGTRIVTISVNTGLQPDRIQLWSRGQQRYLDGFQLDPAGLDDTAAKVYRQLRQDGLGILDAYDAALHL